MYLDIRSICTCTRKLRHVSRETSFLNVEKLLVYQDRLDIHVCVYIFVYRNASDETCMCRETVLFAIQS